MNFRSRPSLPTKLELGRLVLSGIASLALRLGDRVASLAYDSERLPPPRALRGATSLEGAVAPLFEDPAPSAKTDLAAAIRGFSRIERGGLFIVVSDFIESRPADALAALQPFALRRSAMHVVHILDPAEARLSLDVPARIEGLEGEPPIDVTPDPALAAAYDDAIAELVREVRGAALALGATPHFFETSVDPVAAVAEIVCGGGAPRLR